MIAAVVATAIWSVSSLASARGAQHLGGISANLVRLMIALPLLCAVAWCLGLSSWQAAHVAGGGWFLLSGVIGMGLCDILMLAAYARLGARITSLISNVAAAPTAIAISWACLGERPSLAAGIAITVIIAGVAIVLRPRTEDRIDTVGVLCAVTSAITFAAATVMSRLGYATANAAGAPLHWLDATILRVGAGIALCAIAFVGAGAVSRSWRDGPGRWRQALPWLAINALIGPGCGLVCYQWALTTTPAAEVHAVVAALPVLVMVLSWLTGNERPDALSALGTLLAVGGVVGLVLVH